MFVCDCAAVCFTFVLRLVPLHLYEDIVSRHSYFSLKKCNVIHSAFSLQSSSAISHRHVKQKNRRFLTFDWKKYKISRCGCHYGRSWRYGCIFQSMVMCLVYNSVDENIDLLVNTGVVKTMVALSKKSYLSNQFALQSMCFCCLGLCSAV